MATDNKNTTGPAPSAADFDEAAALFEGNGTTTGGKDEDLFADVDDLLGTVQEDDAEGWNPSEVGEFVAGIVTKVGVTRSDFARDGEDPNCPTVTVLTKEGDKYRVIGFGAVLKRELADADPQVGDLIAVKYWGERQLKKGKFAGKNYRHYSVGIKHKS